MNKLAAIGRVYEIATLTQPTDEIIHILGELEFERVLELMLVMRQYSGKINAPGRFLRRAIDEQWTPETVAQKVNRHKENRESAHWQRRGLSPEAAQRKVVADRNMPPWEVN